LYALAYFCFIKNKKLIYYTTQIPSHLKSNLTGNLKEAIDFKAIIIEINKQDFKEKIHTIKNKLAKNEFFIEQGGRDKYSKYGIKDLSILIKNFIKQNNMKDIDIFVPSGTGTSAFYLQNYLQNYRVCTTPCVGDESYLKQQFEELSFVNEMKYKKYPTIINTTKKYHFGKCYKDFYEMYQKTKLLNVDFELLYDMKTLLSIQENSSNTSGDIIYIHCGGTYANKSMEKRYMHNIIKKENKSNIT